jgi:hypothetical protein
MEQSKTLTGSRNGSDAMVDSRQRVGFFADLSTRALVTKEVGDRWNE